MKSSVIADDEYAIGQIVYVRLRAAKKFIPAQIMEKITRETCDGCVTEHIVGFGKASDDRINIASIDGNVYTSIQSVRELLQKQADAFVEKMLKQIDDCERGWFEIDRSNVLPIIERSNQKKEEKEREGEEEESEQDVVIDLGDGKFGRLKQTR